MQLRFASDEEKKGPTPFFVLSIPGPWSHVISPSMNLLSHAGPCRKARRLAWQYSRGEPSPALAHGTLDIQIYIHLEIYLSLKIIIPTWNVYIFDPHIDPIRCRTCAFSFPYLRNNTLQGYNMSEYLICYPWVAHCHILRNLALRSFEPRSLTSTTCLMRAGSCAQ